MNISKNSSKTYGEWSAHNAERIFIERAKRRRFWFFFLVRLLSLVAIVAGLAGGFFLGGRS